MAIKPMLSAKLKKGQTYEDDYFPHIKNPVMVSPKLDGIRCIMHPTLGPVTRTLKPIPNKYLREKLLSFYPSIIGLDGELVSGDHETKDYKFRDTVSDVMSHEGEPNNVIFWVFDQLDPNDPSESFHRRVDNYRETVHIIDNPFFKSVPQEICNTLTEILDAEQKFVMLGYEGIMVRDMTGPYKYGRSTLKKQELVAIKRFEDSEAEIIDILPLYRNNNEPIINEVGLQERSSSKEGKVADELMGKIVVKATKGSHFEGKTFNIGSGFDEDMRIEIWDNKNYYIGKVVTYTYQNHGIVDKPRIPIFKAFRDGY